MTKRKRLTPAQLRRQLEWDYLDHVAGRASPLVKLGGTVGPEQRVIRFRRGRTCWRRIEWRGDTWWEKAT